VVTTRKFSYNTENKIFLMSFIFSLFHNNQPLTFLAVADCGFTTSAEYSFEVRTECHLELLVCKARTSYIVITSW